MRRVDGDLSERAKHWRPKDAEAHLRKRSKETKAERREARLAERAREVKRRMAIPCECGKVKTHDRDDAEWLFNEVLMHKGESVAVRWYTCRWSRWHWTRHVR